MPAGLYAQDQMFAVGTGTWHGREIFRDVVRWEEAYELAGIKQPHFRPVTVDGVFSKAHQAIMVEGTNQPLAIVSARYRLLDGRKAFDVLDEIVKSGVGAYETAGTLKGQRIMWGLLKLTDSFRVGKQDEVRPYVFLTDFRDGTGAARFGTVLTRVVCQNTHHKALGESGLQVIRHTGDVQGRIEEAARILGLVSQQIEQTAEAYNLLDRVSVSQGQVQEFLAGLIPDPKKPTDRSKEGGYQEALNRARLSRLKVYDLFDGQMQGAEQIAGNTLWRLFNATTEWVDHHRNPDMAGGNRLYMKTLGVGQQIKSEAFGRLLTMAGARS